MAGFTAATGDDNVPTWAVDPGSPKTATNTNSVTYTLTDEYDRVEVDVQIADNSLGLIDLGLRVNGDTGANYDYVDYYGDLNTGESQVDATRLTPKSSVTIGMDGRWSGRWSYGRARPMPYGAGGKATIARNTSVSGPLTQFTLFDVDGNNPDEWTIAVRGRDI